MPSIVRNGVYANPNLAPAFEGLASIFAPPSAQEAFAGARARSENDKAARMRELFRMAGDPNMDRGVFDMRNIAAGNYAPNVSFYGVDTDAATRRYTSDNALKGTKYSADASAGAAIRAAEIAAQQRADAALAEILSDPNGRQAVTAGTLPGPFAGGWAAAQPVAPTLPQVQGGILQGAADGRPPAGMADMSLEAMLAASGITNYANTQTGFTADQSRQAAEAAAEIQQKADEAAATNARLAADAVARRSLDGALGIGKLVADPNGFAGLDQTLVNAMAPGAGLPALPARDPVAPTLSQTQAAQVAAMIAQGVPAEVAMATVGAANYANTQTGFTADQSRQAAEAAAKVEKDGLVALLDAARNPNGGQGVNEALVDALAPGRGIGALPEQQPVAPTEAQVKGATLSGLSPADRRAVAMDSVGVESVLKPDGTPELVNRPDAAGRTPTPPAQGAQAAKKAVTLYDPANPDAPKIAGFFDPATGALATADGKPAPAGYAAMNLPTPSGSMGDATGATTANRTEGIRVRAEVNRAETNLRDFRALLDANSGVAGWAAKIRGVAQDLSASLGELAAAAQEDGVSLADLDGMVQGMARQFATDGQYDPAIRQFRVLALSMAYDAARMSGQSGKIAVAELRNWIDLFNGGLGSDQAVRAALDAHERLLRSQRQYGEDLINPRPSGGAAGGPGAITPEQQGLLDKYGD